MSEKFKVSSTPHGRAASSTAIIMMLVVIALLPAAGFGIYNFGARAALVLLVTIVSCVGTEFLFGLYKKKLTITDLSAVVTGLLLGMNLPVT
ncbi:MAG: RnfABCDGE type electron transport complex subunit D, partial [Lachnospiraceae bacterium]|nr:RnfABCDGE type electron transport complex subunit D [Lachnospiraceae bacterium]